MAPFVCRVVFGLCLAAGALGLWLGLRAPVWDESAAIEMVAARYVSETGGARSDCVARPGGAVWLEVFCGDLRYEVHRDGGVTRLEAGT